MWVWGVYIVLVLVCLSVIQMAKSGSLVGRRVPGMSPVEQAGAKPVKVRHTTGEVDHRTVLPVDGGTRKLVEGFLWRGDSRGKLLCLGSECPFCTARVIHIRQTCGAGGGGEGWV